MAPHQIVAVVGLALCALYLSCYKRIAEMVGPRQNSDPAVGIFRILASLFLFVFGPVIAYVLIAICILMALIP